MKSDKKANRVESKHDSSSHYNCLFQIMRLYKSHEAYEKKTPSISNIPKSNSKNNSAFKPKQSSPHIKTSLKAYINSPSMFARNKHYYSQKIKDDNDDNYNNNNKEDHLRAKSLKSIEKSSNNEDNDDNNVGDENINDDSGNVLEIDDSIIEQEDNDHTIDTDLDEKKETDFVLKGKTHIQLNNQLIHRTPKIAQNPFTMKVPEQKNDDIKQVIDTKEDLCKQLLINARKGDKETFLSILNKCLVLNKDCVNYKDDNNYWTSLHYACDEGNLKIVEILLKANCDINIQSKNKQTPLHLSSERGYFDISKLLIENGACMTITDNEKNTVIHLCAMSGHIQLMKYLLEKTLEDNMKNIHNQTPLDLSKTSEMKDVLKAHYQKKISQHQPHIPSVEIIITEFNTSANISDEDIPRLSYDKVGRAPIRSHKNSKTSIHNKSNEFHESSPITKAKIRTNRQDDIIPSYYISFKDDNITVNSRMIKTTSKLLMNNRSNKSTASPINHLNTKPHTTKNTLAYGYKNCPKYSLQIANQADCNSIKNKSITENNINQIKSKSTDKEINEQSFQSKYLNTTQNTSRKIDKNIISYSNVKQSHIDLGNITTELNLMEEEKITPCSFICLGILGKGSFGEVFLVEKIDTKNLYAMKVISKNRIENQNLFRYAMAERNVLSLTNHPFIVKLSFAFQTNDKLFLVIDYCPNGDLAKHLMNEKRFTEERAKYYICEILLALEDLHKRDIIFRDLKPDNIVLDKDGHAKVTDFGLSKEGVFDSIGAKSFCGSIAYLAPEMLQRQGHGKAVDWYLLGVLFYEMLVGIPPFFTDQKEDIFRNIEKGELQIPKFVSKEAGSILRELLRKNPLERIGGGKDDAEEIKRHPYFTTVDWENVYNKKISPPKLKTIKNHVQYFSKGKMFVNNETLFGDSSYRHFSNWSFINNDPIENEK